MYPFVKAPWFLYPMDAIYSIKVPLRIYNNQACVGPVGFVFSVGRQDTVSRHTIPLDFEYIAAGHIHRY
jgi:hypothetical protein